MTQNQINKYFLSPLGDQCDSLFSTSDGRVFIRYDEALKHVNGELDSNTTPLEDKTIIEWFEEYSGTDLYPAIRNEVLGIDTESDDFKESQFEK